MPEESDWKKFKAMVPPLRERCLAARNGPIAARLTDPKKSATERFRDAMEEMEKEAKLPEPMSGPARGPVRRIP
jgi:hypothetical protein